MKPYYRYPDGGVAQPGSAAERSGRAVARRAGAQQGRARQPGDGDEGVPQEAAGQNRTSNEGPRIFHNHVEGPHYGLLLVKSTY